MSTTLTTGVQGFLVRSERGRYSSLLRNVHREAS
jgi:hypothetical protein